MLRHGIVRISLSIHFICLVTWTYHLYMIDIASFYSRFPNTTRWTVPLFPSGMIKFSYNTLCHVIWARFNHLSRYFESSKLLPRRLVGIALGPFPSLCFFGCNLGFSVMGFTFFDISRVLLFVSRSLLRSNLSFGVMGFAFLNISSAFAFGCLCLCLLGRNLSLGVVRFPLIYPGAKFVFSGIPWAELVRSRNIPSVLTLRSCGLCSCGFLRSNLSLSVVWLSLIYPRAKLVLRGIPWPEFIGRRTSRVCLPFAAAAFFAAIWASVWWRASSAGAIALIIFAA